MTQREFYLAMIDYLDGNAVEVSEEDMKAFCASRIEQLDKQAGKKTVKKETPEQAEVKEAVLQALSTGEALTVKAIREMIGDHFSSSAVTGALTRLVNAGLVAVNTEGKVGTYHLA